MHELSITRNIVAIVSERAKGRTVTKVRLLIGKLSGIEVPAIRFCYDLCAEGTPLAGSELVIDEVEGRGTCEKCGEVVQLSQPVAICPCPERARLRIDQGEELLVKEMEVT